MSEVYNCPLRGKAGERSLRYPRYICVECGERVTDWSRRPLRFSNVSLSGGYVVRHADTEGPYDRHLCYVHGRACWADEAHMSGIVVSIYDPRFNKE